MINAQSNLTLSDDANEILAAKFTVSELYVFGILGGMLDPVVFLNLMKATASENEKVNDWLAY